MTRHVLEIDDLSPADIERVLELAADEARPPILAGRTVGLYFEKPSLRTRHSSETAVVQLAGHPVTFRKDEIGGSGREPVGDIGRVLSGYHAALGARVFDHRVLEQLAAAASIPVINLLSDTGHPCQSLADLLTMRQAWGDLRGRTIAWIGDFNNVARSLALGAAMSGMRLRIASPSGYGPGEADVDRLLAAGLDGPPTITDRPLEAATGADAVHTDVWASMGQEEQAERRRRDFEGWTLDEAIISHLAPGGVFLHCLPAHRGEEAAAEVVDGPRSRIWPEAENRMHTARGLLAWLLAQDGAPANEGRA
jgi:ornithine carbamoyltransferase